MRTSKFLGLMLCAVMMFFVVSAMSFAAVAVKSASWTNSDVIEFNGHNPSASKTYTGERLRGLFTRETTLIESTGSVDLDVQDKVITFTSGGAGAGTFDRTFADGQPGQTITFVLVTDGGANIIISPETNTGFTSVELDSANDTCTMLYQDDTIGWIATGGNSCTVN